MISVAGPPSQVGGITSTRGNSATAAATFTVNSKIHTVLVSVREGRFFPSNPATKVYIQCRFNNEILTTDPAPHDSYPIWDTELAWDIAAKPLGFLRSQRAKLKITCYEIDSDNRRSQLGYVMLDLRTAASNPPRWSIPESTTGTDNDPSKTNSMWTWHPLINFHSQTPSVFRPELKLAFAVFPKSSSTNNQPNPTKPVPKPTPTKAPKRGRTGPPINQPTVKTPPFSPTSTLSRGSPHQSPRVVRLSSPELRSGHMPDVDSFYQIGPTGYIWALSVTLAFAENLELLQTKESLTSPQSSGGYFFYYSFLGMDVATERFFDLKIPKFSPIRKSFQFKATEDDMNALLQEERQLLIHLCCDGNVIGFAEVNLAALLTEKISASKNNLDQIDVPYKVLEQIYTLYSPQQDVVYSVDSRFPGIGVSLVLSLENQSGEVPASSPINKPVFEISPESVPESAVPSTATVAPSTAANQEQASLSQNERPALQWHHFRFSIDLRSITKLTYASLTKANGLFTLADLYFKFNYEAFGAFAPFISTAVQPSVYALETVSDAVAIQLPHSFCSYEFVMGVHQLNTYLEAAPLTIEMCTHNSMTGEEIVLGTTTVSFASIQTADVRTRQGGAQYKSVEILLPVIAASPSGASSMATGRLPMRVGELKLVIGLEDYGLVEDDALLGKLQENLPSISFGDGAKLDEGEDKPEVLPNIADPVAGEFSLRAGSPTFANVYHGQGHNSATTLAAIRGTEEYKSALDLVIWQREEMKKFKQQLKKTEADHIAKLNKEFATKEAERSQELAKNIKSLEEIEAKTKSLAEQLEEREHVIRKAEYALQRQKDDFESYMKRRELELQEITKRVTEEYKARMDLERVKLAESESARLRAARERDEIETKLKNMQKAYDEFRQSVFDGKFPAHFATAHDAAIAAVRAELSKVLEKSEGAGKKIQSLENSKRHYKRQWLLTLQELAKVKKAWQSEMEHRLLSSQKEVETMKLKLLAKDEVARVDEDRKLLESLRGELDKLKSSTLSNKGESRSNNESPLRIGGSSPKKSQGISQSAENRENMDPEVLREVERLAGERDSLLDTGLYTREDRIIRELDARIGRLL